MRSRDDSTMDFIVKGMRHPSSVLRREEALTLCWQVKRMQEVERCTDGLAAAEVERIRRVGAIAKERLVKGNMGLVVSIAKKYQGRGLPLADLVQEGAIGLSRGIDKFDPGRGYQLSTYCWHWIRQGITRALAQQCRIVHIPVHVHGKLNQVKKVARELSQATGRTPTISEIARAMGVKEGSVRQYVEWGRNQPKSLEASITEDGEVTLVDALASPGESPEAYSARLEQEEYLEQILASLTEEEAETVRDRYGIGGKEPLTYPEIGAKRGQNPESIRGVHRRAMGELRRAADVRCYL